MSDDQIIGDPLDPVAPPVARRQFDSGFKRNMLIIGGTVAIAAIVIVAIVFGTKSRLDSAKERGPTTSIPATPVVAGGSPTQLTPADEARLGRVQGRESDAASEKKDTYIPRDLVTRSEAVLQAPATQTAGPGVGYAYNVGDRSGQAVDPQREAAIRKGIEVQLNGIIAKMEPPGTQSAPAYQPPQQPGNSQQAAAAAPAASAAAGKESGEVLARGLSIAGARLASPCDTSKTPFISSVINTGPLTGAYLVGQCKMVGDEGVQVTFNRMTFGGESYVVNVTGLDNATSSDAMAADIDRKLLSRYVMPIAFTTLQGYMGAIARPSQTVVATANVPAQIVTPSATAREAVATGIAAGLGKAGEGLGQAKPSAFMPIDTGIALLFNEPVLKKVAK